MADVRQTATTQSFIASIGQAVIQTEDQALSVYYQMQSYPELKRLLSLHNQEITKALQQKNTSALISIIQKVQSDFLRTTAELPDQIQQDTEKKIKEAQLSPEEITRKVDNAKEALGETHKTAESMHATKRKQNQTFIEKLVKNYSKLPPAEAESLTKTIIAAAEAYPELPPQQIIQNATQTIPQVSQVVIHNLLKHRDITQSVASIQKNDVATIEQQIIQAVLDSPEPVTTVQAIRVYGDTPVEIPTIIKNAQVLANASASAKVFSGQTELDYLGFFSNISKNGTLVEKTLAPVADTIFSLFPKKAQEATVLKILGSSWNKEVSNNTLIQKTIGPLFQSPSVQQAIKSGNALFQPGGKGAVFTKTQSFFVDVFITVFHPQVSEVYLKLAGVGNTQMNSSLGAYYAGWITSQGAQSAVKKGARVAGEKIAEKTAGTAAGKVIGGLLGSEGGPIGSFVGSLVFDKLLGGLWSGAKKTFNFLTLGWMSNLVTGNYESTPLTKDPSFILAVSLICVTVFLFIIPILPFTVVGNSLFQQTVQDSAYIQGIGTGDETGPAIDCTAEPTNPLCSMKSCDASQQDCRWPTSGTITQGPYTSCGGTHRNANAIDIAGASGADVYATINGTVDKVSRGCVDNTGSMGNMCGGYLGNYVVITGMCGSNAAPFSCTLTFGHLKQNTIRVSQGQSVRATDVIGEMDHTGNSSGTHLHFSMKNTSHSINEILPFAIGHCVNGTGGCTPCSYPHVGGGK